MNILVELFCTFFKIGAFTFGGGYAMFSLLGHECVEKRNWITSDELLDIAVIAESTPGPIAINCATYTGYKKAKTLGAVIATIGMVLPSFIIILIISKFFHQFISITMIANAFKGIRVAVALLILQAAVKMIRQMKFYQGKKAVPIVMIIATCLISITVNLYHAHLSTIYLIVVSGIIGYCVYGLPRERRKKKND